jgi:cytochrome b
MAVAASGETPRTLVVRAVAVIVRLRQQGERNRRMAREAAVIRVWDLPTRLFHWALAFGVVAAIVSARLGGGAMAWHLRLGYAIFALLAFRLLWGFVGGHWSRFATFVVTPAATVRYLRGHEARPAIGHSPLAAWSVLALLGVLAAQVATGLVADDEVATNGPLFKHVANATSETASHWHRGWGQWTLIALILLHLVAIAFYNLRGRPLAAAMWHGDQPMVADAPAARDTFASRLFALALLAVCALAVASVASLGE